MRSASEAVRGLAAPMKSLARDVLACLRFFTRAPVPNLAMERDPFGLPDFSRAAGALGLVGALIGAFAAAVLLLALAFGLSSGPAAAFAMVALVAATGALHEDGLADVADGFGGGQSAESKLAIMKDSRIGSFGAAALVLCLLLRWTLLASLSSAGAGLAATALVSAGAVSRVAALAPMVLLAPARRSGAGAALGRPSPRALAVAAASAAFIGLAPALAREAPIWPLLGCALAVAATWLTAMLSRRQIGGFTGDVVGAAQQAAEIAYLSALCMGVRWLA